MLMWMNRKMRKNKKGFTLIELIIVIAILAILALIAIPRLAGFTNKAKEANDKELASIVAHSLETLIASGDIRINPSASVVRTVTLTNDSAGTLNYSPSAGICNKNTTAYTTISENDLETLIVPLVGNTKALQRATQIVITVQDDGEINVGTDIDYTFPTN